MSEWSPQQNYALRSVANWFQNKTKEQQVFRLFGTAGTGKTTLAKHFAQNVTGQVKFATYTGKAAHVMVGKGCEGATTIHRLIYRPKMASKHHLKILENELEIAKSHPSPSHELITRLAQELDKERMNVGRMNFSLNLESDLRFAKLLILDECSMIDAGMGQDLESFGVPILVLGDPEQLPPIYGQGYFTEKEPDIMLTEIHRQARDNPIIHMAQLVREGKPLPLGTYGASRVVGHKLEPDDILDHDIILTGLRKTKRACDEHCRKIMEITSPLPIEGDKIMCIKNNHGMGLLNGQMWEMAYDCVEMAGGLVSLHLKDPTSELELAVCASAKLFLGQSLQRWEHEEDIEEFEYAYAITVHKSQGSQWDKVMLYDQKDKFPMMSERDRRRWLYTGITRAAEIITVVRP
jgi:exodeoxyribonuclease-5